MSTVQERAQAFQAQGQAPQAQERAQAPKTQEGGQVIQTQKETPTQYVQGIQETEMPSIYEADGGGD